MLSNYVAQELSHKIGSKVSIDNIQIGLFNRLIINNICISDRQHEILLKAHLATTKIELRSLFKQQLSLRTVSLLDADVNLYQQKLTAQQTTNSDRCLCEQRPQTEIGHQPAYQLHYSTPCQHSLRQAFLTTYPPQVQPLAYRSG